MESKGGENFKENCSFIVGDKKNHTVTRKELGGKSYKILGMAETQFKNVSLKEIQASNYSSYFLRTSFMTHSNFHKLK